MRLLIIKMVQGWGRNEVLGGLGQAEMMGKASVKAGMEQEKKTSNSPANNLFLLQSHRRSDGGRMSEGQKCNMMREEVKDGLGKEGVGEGGVGG